MSRLPHPTPAEPARRRSDGKSRTLRPADFVALAQLRFALRRFMAFSENAAAGCGLTPQQHQALLAIKAAPDETMTVGEVADWLLLRPHSAGELIDRLERMRLVERHPDASDRRKVHIGLTQAAQDKLDALSSAHFEELRAIGPLLRNLLGHFDKEGGDA
ncbi:HTH marR-type domain-containing protein [Bordetella sputigena]|uniref:MarR family winged helix-turn-helix transcriptional regulator n=1 Tax=Bordetella sputigena TaxID=1416810 RepID=UPI0039EF00B5